MRICSHVLRRGGASARCLSALLATLVAAPACQRTTAHEVTVVDGATTTHFDVKSAYAEYVELPSVRNELRVTLASYPVSCERWAPPGKDDSVVTVTVVLPADKQPVVATYGWTGIPPQGAPIAAPYALPKAELGSRSRLFEPGGSLRISALQLDARGAVSGTLAFEFPGDAERPATRIDGGFDAKMCRLSLAGQ